MLTNLNVNNSSMICSSVNNLPDWISMARKRIRIDLEDSDGAKYNLSLEGNVTREKMLKIFELMNLINIEETEKDVTQLDSVGAKIWNVIDKNFPIGKFTSSMILEKYEDEYEEPIKLSIISTYLSRFTIKGKVSREKQGKEWSYQILKVAQKEKNLT
jgi:hypothetical protein